MMENIFEQIHNYWMILGFVGTGIAAVIRTNITTKHRLSELEKHANDMDKHWTLEKKVDYFVPRTEVDQRFKNIGERFNSLDKMLERIDKKIDK